MIKICQLKFLCLELRDNLIPKHPEHKMKIQPVISPQLFKIMTGSRTNLSHSSAWHWRDPSASALINNVSSFRNSATRALIDSSEQPIEMIRSIDFPAWSFFNPM